MENIIVIGAGQAGAALCAKLRDLGYEGGLSLIGDEPEPPYQRPPLSKAYLLGEMEKERLYLRPAEFYGAQNIELITGQSAAQIDRGRKTVRLGDKELPYDALALTTGAQARGLPAALGGDLDGVFTLRSLADMDALAPKIRAGAKALIIGGGYIGLEAAAVAAKQGVQVTLIEREARILSRVAAPQTAEYFRALHRAHGVQICEGIGLTRLIAADGEVRGAELSDGREIAADFVIVGIGVIPGEALAQAAGLACDHGIKVDGQGRTSDPSIWAAGDCTVFAFGGAPTRLESVQNAIDQAEAVAANMLGAEIDYAPKPWFWSDQYDVKLQIAGLNRGYDQLVVRPGAREGSRSHWYFGKGQLLAVDAMNDPRAYMIGKRLIEAGRSPASAQIADPETDLKVLMAG
ncbi:MAG: FAD-dependent oxidoreductase [Mangrovicoccus sp.]|nr:FAD-dependent oxidoreductase [Mangrovicoccus sp.]